MKNSSLQQSEQIKHLEEKSREIMKLKEELAEERKRYEEDINARYEVWLYY